MIRQILKEEETDTVVPPDIFKHILHTIRKIILQKTDNCDKIKTKEK